MNRHILLASSVSIAAFVCGASCDRPSAAEAADGVESLEPVSRTIFGERLLLYMEYPHLVRGAPARFLAHLSVLDTGEPVRSGSVTLQIGSTRFSADAPKRDGLFIPEGSLPEPGTFTGSLVVKSDQAEESLDLGEIAVHASHEEAVREAGSDAGIAPPGAVPFLMEQQWRLKLLLARSGPGTVTRRLTVPARVRTPEGAEAEVASALGGRLLARADTALPRTGDEVAAGQVLAEVEPPLGAAEIAQLQALGLELDLKALEIERALGEAQALVEFSRRERERISALREQGLSTQQALDEAERDLRIAQGQLESAKSAEQSLRRMAEERGGQASGASRLGVRLPVVSPLAGTVVAAPRLQGAAIEPGDELFRILDTSRVWIEGHVSEFDLHVLEDEPSAIATFAALPGRRIEVGGGGGSSALQLLPLLDADSRTAVLRCEVPNPDGRLMAGMLAQLEIATERVEAEVVVPLEAIVIDQGQPTAFVMLEGELFQKRELELGVKDGDAVQVLRGIEAGEHVATRGAYVVKLAALSPASFGPGHQH